MKNNVISHIKLAQRLEQLAVERDEKKSAIKKECCRNKRFFKSISILKRIVINTVKDKETQESTFKILLNRGISSITDKLFNKDKQATEGDNSKKWKNDFFISLIDLIRPGR